MISWATLLAAALLAGQAPAAATPTGDADAGHDLYASSCRGCHAGAIAPSLAGVVGRGVASAPGYAYSEGLKAKSAQTWTPANLDAFLTAPQAWAPGTKMPKSLPDPQQRADVIAYLASLSASE